MALFVWDEKFMTGIAAIDNQHKKLVGFVNELHDAMKKRQAKDIIEKLLDELVKYTEYHFSTEEKAFAAYGYEGRQEHAKKHDEFIGKVNALVVRHRKSEIALSIDILDFLVEWVKNHILIEDMKYVPALKDKKIEESLR